MLRTRKRDFIFTVVSKTITDVVHPNLVGPVPDQQIFFIIIPGLILLSGVFIHIHISLQILRLNGKGR